ncbi:MAG: hypothetical protein HDR74_05275 [Bacteroides sp.]|nr:hypothetical protein [Bacteroides sp.]
MIIEAESEQMASDLINSYYNDVIAHPKKTVYKYSKKVDNYIPVEVDVDESDCYLISANIISVKESNIISFFGSTKEHIYILRLLVDFIYYKSSPYIAIEARDFKEVVDIITEAFRDSRKMAMIFVSKKYIKNLTDDNYENAYFDVIYLKQSNMRVLSRK